MAYLQQRHYTPLTVTHLAQAMTDSSLHLPDRPVVVTIDDGVADFYMGALPVLTRYGFPATLYVTTGFVGGTSRWLSGVGEGLRPMLTWSQIADVQASGIECGAHSRSHPQLDILARAAARDEIVHCKSELEHQLGRQVVTFAYPHGYYSAAVRRLVQEAGYSSACAVKHAMSATTDDRFALARIIVTDTDDMDGFGQVLAGRGLPVAPVRERVRTRGWRTGRRLAGLFKRRPSLETRIDHATRKDTTPPAGGAERGTRLSARPADPGDERINRLIDWGIQDEGGGHGA
jgi:peptidoglycan/xylan/chitin deacetylase (PgdA/CDA1 family)